MNGGSTKEISPEKRISITPDTSISFKNLGLNVFIEKGYGESLGYGDKDYKDNGSDFNKTEFKASDSIIFSISYLEANGLIVKKNIIELDRYSGFVKHEFRTSNETIYRTGYCKVSKNNRLF